MGKITPISQYISIEPDELPKNIFGTPQLVIHTAKILEVSPDIKTNTLKSGNRIAYSYGKEINLQNQLLLNISLVQAVV
jgi:hypothetical protein